MRSTTRWAPRRKTLARTSSDRPSERAAGGDPGLAAGTRIDGYQIVTRLTEGAMASIYAAYHPGLQKRAAIKVISTALASDRSAVARFLVEARSSNEINHPNVIGVFGFGHLTDGRNYIIMEWLDGQTLGERILAGRIPVAEAIEILLQTCDALSAAHEKGIVHRDVKPDNIFLTRGPTAHHGVRLFDFGVARIRFDGRDRPVEAIGTFVGTPHYCSPEQTRGIAIDERADVYSLGITAYEMILGEIPFDGETLEVLAQQLSKVPARPSTLWPEIPRALERLLLAMLEKVAGRRPSVAAVRRALEHLRVPLPPLLTADAEPYYEALEILSPTVGKQAQR